MPSCHKVFIQSNLSILTCESLTLGAYVENLGSRMAKCSLTLEACGLWYEVLIGRMAKCSVQQKGWMIHGLLLVLHVAGGPEPVEFGATRLALCDDFQYEVTKSHQNRGQHVGSKDKETSHALNSHKTR